MKKSLKAYQSPSSLAAAQLVGKPTRTQVDNRPQVVAQYKLRDTIKKSPQQVAQHQRAAQLLAQPGHTTLPAKTGVGARPFSGYSLGERPVLFTKTPLQRVILINGNNLSKGVIDNKKAQIKEHTAKAVQGVTDEEWDSLFTKLGQLALHETTVEYSKLSEAINLLRTKSVEEVVALAKAEKIERQSLEEETRRYQAELDAMYAMGKDKKSLKAKSTSSSTSSKESKEEVASEEHTPFPHAGKHRPHMLGDTDKKTATLLRELTAGKGKEALYKTQLAAVAIGWEKEALASGLLLADNFTTVHAFSTEIGADQGAMTRYLRMDGEHHGHPIHESDGVVNFDKYIKSDIEKANKEGDVDRLRVIFNWLRKNGLNVNYFERGVSKPLLAKLNE